MITCTKCLTAFDDDVFIIPGQTRCQSCDTLTRIDAFPALYRDFSTGDAGEPVLVDQEASCFYHPKKKAVVPCSDCGRFLCALCDVELNGDHLCLSCLQVTKQNKKKKNLENQKTLYDNIALTLAIGPVLVWFVTFITAPMVIYIVLRYWKRSVSLVPRTKIRYIAAFVIAAAQITGWAVLFSKMAGG